MVVFDRFIKLSLTTFSDDNINQQIEKFFENKDNRGYDRSLAIISDTIRGRAALKARDREAILEWLQTNGYC